MTEESLRALAILQGCTSELVGCHVSGRNKKEAEKDYQHAMKAARKVRDEMRAQVERLNLAIMRCEDLLTDIEATIPPITDVSMEVTA